WSCICSDIHSIAQREILLPVSLAPLIKTSSNGTERTTPLPLQDHQNIAAQSQTLSDAGGYQDASQLKDDPIFSQAALTPLDDWLWQSDSCAAMLCAQFAVKTLAGYSLEDRHEAVRAAGACLH